MRQRSRISPIPPARRTQDTFRGDQVQASNLHRATLCRHILQQLPLSYPGPEAYYRSLGAPDPDVDAARSPDQSSFAGTHPKLEYAQRVWSGVLPRQCSAQDTPASPCNRASRIHSDVPCRPRLEDHTSGPIVAFSAALQSGFELAGYCPYRLPASESIAQFRDPLRADTSVPPPAQLGAHCDGQPWSYRGAQPFGMARRPGARAGAARKAQAGEGAVG